MADHLSVHLDVLSGQSEKTNILILNDGGKEELGAITDVVLCCRQRTFQVLDQSKSIVLPLSVDGTH